jgi:hypothetical protein
VLSAVNDGAVSPIRGIPTMAPPPSDVVVMTLSWGLAIGTPLFWNQSIEVYPRGYTPVGSVTFLQTCSGQSELCDLADDHDHQQPIDPPRRGGFQRALSLQAMVIPPSTTIV